MKYYVHCMYDCLTACPGCVYVEEREKEVTLYMSKAQDVHITNQKAAKERPHTLKLRWSYLTYFTLYFHFPAHISSECSRLEIQLYKIGLFQFTRNRRSKATPNGHSSSLSFYTVIIDLGLGKGILRLSSTVCPALM